MNVLYDLKASQATGTGKRHGGGKYAEMVFSRILELNLNVICFYDSHYAPTALINRIKEGKKIRIIDIKEKSIDSIIKENHIDKIFSALPVNVAHVDDCEIIGTIHGLREIELPLDWYFFKYKGQGWKSIVKFLLRKYVPSIGIGREYNRIRKYYKKNNFNIITVSNHSLFSLRCHFPEYASQHVSMFYSPSTSVVPIEKSVYDERYFLMVSGNRWEKNNLRAIIALDRLFSEGLLSGYRVKITGVKNRNQYRYHIKNPDRFDFLDYVDEIELEQLYHDAYCFLYPSLNEGFGYPPLEAMKYGVPVIASPFSSIPEVCQGAVLYFNPFSIEEIMNRILQICNQEVHDRLSALSFKQYEMITAIQKRDLDRLICYIYEQPHDCSVSIDK